MRIPTVQAYRIKSMVWLPKISLNDGRYVICPFVQNHWESRWMCEGEGKYPYSPHKL